MATVIGSGICRRPKQPKIVSLGLLLAVLMSFLSTEMPGWQNINPPLQWLSVFQLEDVIKPMEGNRVQRSKHIIEDIV
jgi:hypothetical protein